MTYREKAPNPESKSSGYIWVNRRVWTINPIELNEGERNRKFYNFEYKSYKLPKEA